MRDREFIVSFPYDSLRKKGGLNEVSNGFQKLGYVPIPTEASNEKCFEKGKKIATILGLINWNLIYRKVVIGLSDDEKKVLIHYHFSWLTNIGVLIRAAAPELKSLEKMLGIKTSKVERYR